MRIRQYIMGIILGVIAFACEENFDPPTIPGNRNMVVVEGHLEAYATNPSDLGIQPRPAYVILTNDILFGEAFDSEDFENLFVRGASVNISSSKGTSFALQEVCLDALPMEEREFLIEAVGLNSADFAEIGIDFRETNLCFYADLNIARRFDIGETFELSIETGEVSLRATTTAPPFYPIQDISFREPPGDTVFFAGTRLRQMLIQAPVPAVDSVSTYFRYFTQRNDEPLYKGNAPLAGFRSVFEGRILGSGEESIALLRGEARDSSFNPGGNNFGNFRVNDRYLVKWMTIDEAHFNYWNSTEFNALNQGFFSSYTLPQFNIEGEGGIGIFGAYTVGFYGGLVPKE